MIAGTMRIYCIVSINDNFMEFRPIFESVSFDEQLNFEAFRFFFLSESNIILSNFYYVTLFFNITIFFSNYYIIS